VQLVVSDAHRGLTAAIGQILAGAAWQRCRVHFMRNLLTKVPRTQTGMVAAVVRTIFAQPTPAQVREQVDVVAVQLADKFGGSAAVGDGGGDDPPCRGGAGVGQPAGRRGPGPVRVPGDVR
jgi:putative transposase